MARRNLSLLLGLILNFAFAGLLFGQRADRAIITGVVGDQTGASVPGATVTIIDEGTNVQTVVSTSGTGNYGTPPLVLGAYTVKVEKQGFKTFVRSGILLVGGQVYRQDAALELGAMTTTVEVKAASEMINVSSSEVSHALNQRYYQDLPVVMGSDIRLAEALLQAQPGYQAMSPNGDAMFRGSQFNSRINGGQSMATENWMDGAAFGYAFGHGQTQESSPPFEAIREMKVINSGFAAQYGRTSGAFIEYASKAGTNEWHGSVYDYLGNNALNARRFFEYNKKDASGNEKPGTAIAPSKNNDYGFTVGGPIRKQKTFFFTNLALMKMRQIVSSGFVNTVPVTQFRTGDFSRLLTYNTAGALTNVGTDALGRPMYSGEIYKPAVTLVGGIPVRDGYGFDPVTGLPITGQANIIPAGDPLRSQVAAKWNALQSLPDRDQLVQNNYGGAGDPIHIIDTKTWLVRVDHTFTPSLKMSHTFWMNERPAIRKCGGPGGCEVATDPRVDSTKNDAYIGEGFVQRIANRFFHQQFDWIIKPNVFNHTTISYDRWYMGGWSISGGVGWLTKLGIKNLPAASDAGGPPAFNFGGGGLVGYSNRGTNWQRGFQAVNRWQVLDDLTWITGKHTIKMGFEWRWHEFNQAGWARGVAGSYTFSSAATRGYNAAGSAVGSTGDAFASLLLGQVNDANFPIGLDTSISERYWSPWINDEIKLTSKLTLNLGLRFDYQMPRTERHNRMSTFDPTLANPGADNLPGAMLYASASARSFETPKKDAWGPRFGFAYKASNKDSIRGGYGIFYGGVDFDQWMASPIQGFEGNPSTPNTTAGLSPAWYLDTGFPVAAITAETPPITTATLRNGKSAVGVATDGIDLPRYQNWSLSWERQLSPNTLLEVAYVANRGTRLMNLWTKAGYPYANMGDPSNLKYGAALLGYNINTTDPVQQAAIAAAGITKPYPTFTGTVAQALRPFPQYQSINWRNWNDGVSMYHSLQTKLERRFSNGLQLRLAYVYSRFRNDGSESGVTANTNAGSGDVQNPINVHAGEWGLSYEDVPHTVIASYTYQLPFGRGKKLGSNASGVVDKFIGGWGLSGVQRYDSGRPARVTMFNDMGSYIFNGMKRANKGSGGAWGGGNIDPATTRVLISSGWSNPGDLTFGNDTRTDGDVRYMPLYNEDISLYKDTRIRGENTNLRFEAQFGNAFNRTYFCYPDSYLGSWGASGWSNANFGKVSAQCNIPRRIQFGLKFTF